MENSVCVMVAVFSAMLCGCNTSRASSVPGCVKADAAIALSDASPSERDASTRPEDGAFAPDIAIDVRDAVPDAADMAISDAVNPVPGHYSAKLDPARSNPGDSISRLDSYGFTIYMDGDKYTMDATYDGWAHYLFAVANGVFNAQHGDGWSGFSGTNCPTDGFGLVGSFISPTVAVGEYKNLSWRCQIVNRGYFVATLDVPPPEPAAVDAGVPVDAASVDSLSAGER